MATRTRILAALARVGAALLAQPAGAQDRHGSGPRSIK